MSLSELIIDKNIHPRHCPFCGSWKIKPALRIVDQDLQKSAFFLVCGECQSTGPVAGSQRDAAEAWGLKK